MARLNVPEGDGHEIERVWQLNPKLGQAVLGLRYSVYHDSVLPLRIREGLRYIVADCNQCPICLAARDVDGSGAGLGMDFYRLVLEDRGNAAFDERERLAFEYTHRFCHDHFSIDDELMARMRAVFSDTEMFDLCVLAARHLGFGRLTQVLQLDFACAVHVSPSSLAGPARDP
ncbi:carboxymuconolactone decarboxylase family protein [Ramlibacter sp.]|uniref:carboxymuconolactone decarboxylase family protein n=1 Tax=Ramlibacter sp. TaxID=1917967 RepID=UPI003D14BB96